jgi:hypothetical protein
METIDTELLLADMGSLEKQILKVMFPLSMAVPPPPVKQLVLDTREGYTQIIVRFQSAKRARAGVKEAAVEA